MQTVTKYIAKDGSQWDNKADAAKREDLIDKINSAMSRLNATPDDIDFSNGHGFILQDREAVNAARREVYELSKPYLSWWIADQKARRGKTDEELAVVDHPSWCGRILDGFCPPIEKAYARFCCIDDQCREWGQPYFALNTPQSPAPYKPLEETET